MSDRWMPVLLGRRLLRSRLRSLAMTPCGGRLRLRRLEGSHRWSQPGFEESCAFSSLGEPGEV